MNLTDHAGVRLTHGKPKVNGVEIHYAIGGAGEPVFLVHGTPKTMSYWRHVVPLLTPHYTVIAVDNRGAGGSQRPLTSYDTARPTPNRTARITPTRSPARSWRSAPRPISERKYRNSSRRWPTTSAAPSYRRLVTTSRWRTRPPWPRPTSTSSQAAEQREPFRPSPGSALWAADAFHEVLPGLGDSMFDFGGVG